MIFLLALGLAAGSANAAPNLDIHAPTPYPGFSYTGEMGEKIDFHPGDRPLTAVHFWATWCHPCVRELPQVDATNRAYNGRGFQILPLSLDGKNIGKVKEFYSQNHIQNLPALLDADSSAFHAAHSSGLPTTIFINAKGEEIARAVGPIDWTSSEVKDFIDAQLKK